MSARLALCDLGAPGWGVLFRIVLYSHLGVAMSIIRFFLCLAAIPILAMTQ